MEKSRAWPTSLPVICSFFSALQAPFTRARPNQLPLITLPLRRPARPPAPVPRLAGGGGGIGGGFGIVCPPPPRSIASRLCQKSHPVLSPSLGRGQGGVGRGVEIHGGRDGQHRRRGEGRLPAQTGLALLTFGSHAHRTKIHLRELFLSLASFIRSCFIPCRVFLVLVLVLLLVLPVVRQQMEQSRYL